MYSINKVGISTNATIYSMNQTSPADCSKLKPPMRSLSQNPCLLNPFACLLNPFYF